MGENGAVRLEVDDVEFAQSRRVHDVKIHSTDMVFVRLDGEGEDRNKRVSRERERERERGGGGGGGRETSDKIKKLFPSDKVVVRYIVLSEGLRDHFLLCPMSSL